MTGDLLSRLVADPNAVASLAEPLPDAVAGPLVDHLKREADRHWWIDANRSLELANLIVLVGERRNDPRQTALGLMARGDALKFLGQIEPAWDVLEQAGALFRAAGDEVGWGRTRIGRLLISLDLGRVDEALRDADEARAKFAAHGAREILLRLDLNTGIVFDLLGDYRQALSHYEAALAVAETLGEAGQAYLGALYTNRGYAYSYLGELDRAMADHERACEVCLARGEMHGAAVAQMNMAHIEQAQGRYRRALARLHDVVAQVGEHLLLESTARRDMVACYLALNRYPEARELALNVAGAYREAGAAYEMARTLLLLAQAEGELDHFDAALAALDEAEDVFASLSSDSWLATSRLWRARIAWQQGNVTAAQDDLDAALAFFATSGQQADLAAARLVEAQVHLAASRLDQAEQAARAALTTARELSLPGPRYGAHLLLGRLRELEGRTGRATREYQAAACAVERVQRRLTITLRPGFLEDKQDALRALVRLSLREGRPARAFEALERAKSQVSLSYIANRETLRWPVADPQTRALLDELDQLRAEHHWYYRAAHADQDPDQPEGRVDSVQARRELAERERRMRGLTERLYLSVSDDVRAIVAPGLDMIQAALGDDTLLVEFYIDGEDLYAFGVGQHFVTVAGLPATLHAVERMIEQFYFNVSCALRSEPGTPAARSLAQLGRQLLSRLYDVLLAPVIGRFATARRLVVVPFGVLHYLPFHLLADPQGRHLIERAEVVTFPAAGLLCRAPLQREPGALVLTYSRNGALPHTAREGERVQRLLGGELYREASACRSHLERAPRQVLHIAAHGEHRLDQPDLSYIELADGQVFTDDLLQHDLGYELVTLSACETGRATVAPGDELIGLGRGFLYAGAGALLTSLWRVADATAARWMESFYRSLIDGLPKAAAARSAHRALLAEDGATHPAYWGAFQLVGDPRPLSCSRDRTADRSLT